MRHKRFDDALDAAESSPETHKVTSCGASHPVERTMILVPGSSGRSAGFTPHPPAPPWGQRHASRQAAKTEAAESALVECGVKAS